MLREYSFIIVKEVLIYSIFTRFNYSYISLISPILTSKQFKLLILIHLIINVGFYLDSKGH